MHNVHVHCTYCIGDHNTTTVQQQCKTILLQCHIGTVKVHCIYIYIHVMYCVPITCAGPIMRERSVLKLTSAQWPHARIAGCVRERL